MRLGALGCRRASLSGAAFASALGLLGALAWVAPWPRLGSMAPGFIPMAPSTGLLLLSIGAALLLDHRWPSPRRTAAVALLVAVAAAVNLMLVLTGLPAWIDALFIEQPDMFGGVPLARMSPLTAVGLLLAGASLCLTSLPHRLRSLRNLGGLLAVLAAALSLIVVVGYGFSAPLLYGGRVVPMALTTALALSGLSVTALARAGPDELPLRLLIGPSVQARLLRSLAPIALAALLVEWLFFVGEPTMNPGLRQALIALLVMLVVALVGFRVARSVGGSVDRLNDERDRAEAAVRAGERKYRTLVEKLHEGICAVDVEGRITYANPRMAEMLGYAAAEAATMVGRPAVDFMDAAGGELARVALARRSQGITESYPFEFVRKDGSRIRTIVEVAPLLNERGADTGSLAAIRDVTELHRAEERIQRLNRLYRTTSEINQLIVRDRGRQSLLDAACRILVETGEFCLAWVGVPDPEASQLRASASAGATEYLDGLEVRIDDSPAGRGPQGQAFKNREHAIVQDWTADARVAPWREKGLSFGIRSSAGVPIVQGRKLFGVLGVYAGTPHAFDEEVLGLLTELAGDLAFALQGIEERERREQAERALNASERKYRHFFEQDLAGHYVSTPEGRVVACNSAFARILGFRSAEAAMDTDLAACYPSARARQTFLQRIETADRVDRLELELRRRDGTPVAVIESAVGVRDEQGTLQEIHGFLIDDTERKKAEAEFRQAQKMEAVGRLAGGVAHDFNNLLSVIIGHSELLRRRLPEHDPQRGKVEQIQRAAERGAGLIRQLLAFSRRQVIDARALRLNQVVRDTERMLRQLIGEDVRLVTVLCEDPGLVMADAGQVEQAIMNLAVNARDAMPRGGTLTIETAYRKLDANALHPRLAAGRYFELSVRDTGCGMDAATQAHVFEPFFTTKEAGKGTGLGLATVYGVVNQCGGHIELESAPGEGTTFRIWFPLVEGVLQAESTPVQEVALAGGFEAILLLEDDDGLRSLVQETLELAGYAVLPAALPEEGRARAHTHPERIDLLLTDVVMPGMSGPDFAAELVALRPRIKVLYMSGYSNEGVAQRGVGEGGARMLQKPFTPEALLSAVRATLDSPAERPEPNLTTHEA